MGLRSLSGTPTWINASIVTYNQREKKKLRKANNISEE
jgi:nicotinamide mononucleotide (NMN) deamidase PncC